MQVIYLLKTYRQVGHQHKQIIVLGVHSMVFALVDSVLN